MAFSKKRYLTYNVAKWEWFMSINTLLQTLESEAQAREDQGRSLSLQEELEILQGMSIDEINEYFFTAFELIRAKRESPVWMQPGQGHLELFLIRSYERGVEQYHRLDWFMYYPDVSITNLEEEWQWEMRRLRKVRKPTQRLEQYLDVRVARMLYHKKKYAELMKQDFEPLREALKSDRAAKIRLALLCELEQQWQMAVVSIRELHLLGAPIFMIDSAYLQLGRLESIACGLHRLRHI